MKVYIYVYDGMYCGLHGVEDYGVFDINDMDEAKEIINEKLEELIDSFGLEDDYGDDYDQWYGEGGGEVFKIKEDVPLSTEELDQLAYELGRDEFIEKYCED